jgi:thiamine kinase-like enzyme
MSTTTTKAERINLPTQEELAACLVALQHSVELLSDFRWRIDRCSSWEEYLDNFEQIELATHEDIGRLFSAYGVFRDRLVEAMSYVEEVRSEGLAGLETARVERLGRLDA